jgi:DNA-binding NarL/FixJ family response regulator
MSTVLVADDHPLLREAVQIAVREAFPDHQNVVLEASSLEEAKQLAEENQDIDLVLIDLLMPGMEGMSSLVEFRHDFPALPLVIISCIDDPEMIEEALAYGAVGYLPKTLSKSAIASALRSILAGEIYIPKELELARGYHLAKAERKHHEIAHRLASLTPQQLRVLRLIAEGKPNKIIAYELGVGETTVKAHTTVILRKLGVHSRTQAVLAARAHFAAFGA